jgi:hypothetical protein
MTKVMLVGARLMGPRRGVSRSLHQRRGDDARLIINTAAVVNVMLVR